MQVPHEAEAPFPVRRGAGADEVYDRFDFPQLPVLVALPRPRHAHLPPAPRHWDVRNRACGIDIDDGHALIAEPLDNQKARAAHALHADRTERVAVIDAPFVIAEYAVRPDMPGCRPLPVAPRPFEAKVLGGWIGRTASHYKLSVDAFERACSVLAPTTLKASVVNAIGVALAEAARETDERLA